MQRIKWMFLLLAFVSTQVQSQNWRTEYTDAFANSNHPQVAYWFIDSSMLEPQNFKNKIDSFAAFSKYTLIFLTARGNITFYDSTRLHPVFAQLVNYAHSKRLQIGLQIWKDDNGVKLENTDRLIQEGELQLDDNGNAQYTVTAKGAREMENLLQSELFKVYAFKRTGDGFYDLATLQDITDKVKAVNSLNNVTVSINAGSKLKGYTAYILTQHYYKSCSNFSSQAKSILLNAFKAYADIPFDGIGLDEYKNLRIARSKILKENHDVFRERLYSLGMAAALKKNTGIDAATTLFNMRYAPEGKPQVRIKAINEYMALLRTATLNVEAAMYDLGKKMYGQKTFIGLHNTFHNNLDSDEIWQTGTSWWNIKRDYGHTDENTPTAIQMGVGMGYAKNAMYNMYYSKILDEIWTKPLYDLRFGVRTHYHAANDTGEWGVSIESSKALEQINKVENAARLMNRFNPSFPKMPLLVVYGMEALDNWYPHTASRGMYDLNTDLDFMEKSVELWKNGYLHAAIPSDMIEDGRLKLNAAGKPVLNGNVFDAIVFLNPQYTKKAVTSFMRAYVDKGGKLLIEGEATTGFSGNDVQSEWKPILAKAVTGYSLENIEKLGVTKNKITDGVANSDGSCTFTSIASVKTNQPAQFEIDYGANHYSGFYKGIAVIKIDKKGNLEKLAATAFTSLKKNDKTIVQLGKEADLFLDAQNKTAVIADKTKSIKLVVHE